MFFHFYIEVLVLLSGCKGTVFRINPQSLFIWILYVFMKNLFIITKYFVPLQQFFGFINQNVKT